MAPSHPPPPNIQAIPPPHPAHIPELQNIICDPTFPKSSPYHSTRRRPAECHPIPFQFFPTLDVRHAVFIKEQQCSSTAEVDDDDARSTHWVAFAQEDKKRKEVPAATVRLVPWNPEEHAHSEEPYVKIERLATLSPFRGRSYARLLVDAAVEYAQQHPGQCTKPFPAPDYQHHMGGLPTVVYSKGRKVEGVSPTAPIEEIEAAIKTQREEARVKKEKEAKEAKWNGLVLARAPKAVVPWFQKLGFDTEEGWEEEDGYVNAWKRVDV